MPLFCMGFQEKMSRILFLVSRTGINIGLNDIGGVVLPNYPVSSKSILSTLKINTVSPIFCDNDDCLENFL